MSGASAVQYPISVLPIVADKQGQDSLGKLIKDDLSYSTLFRFVDPSPIPSSWEQVKSTDWKQLGVGYVVRGEFSEESEQRAVLRIQLWDTIKKEEVVFVVRGYTKLLRDIAHKVADIIYTKITGEPGFFTSRIAYIRKSKMVYDLMIADYDGYNSQSAFTSREPILSLAWSPEGNRIAYVSFENKKPQVWIQDLDTATRQLVANFHGNNSAPAWSPDGQYLAVTLTIDGRSQIYIVRVGGRQAPRRLMDSPGIDTEPCWSPDGNTIYFTSDRGGVPQIYKIPANGGEVKRISFTNNYNARPRISPDGRYLTHLTKVSSGDYRIAVMALDRGEAEASSLGMFVLTDTSADESPSFSPNGRLILYSTQNSSGQGILAMASLDARNRTWLSVPGYDLQGPAWGPITTLPTSASLIKKE